MSILVVYSSKHGATKEIAERIAGQLTSAGQKAEARPVKSAGDLTGYDAYVIGSAAYMGHWRREAVDLVRRYRGLLAVRPVWLFSSGPLGTEKLDAKGIDKRESTVPVEIAELRRDINARDHRVFFGALARARLDLGERLIALLPAAKELFQEGDFRDWADIEGWADGIARELS